MEMNYLYKFDFLKLFNSNINNNILECSLNSCLLSSTIVPKRDSLLVDQIKQIKNPDMNMEELLVIFDFSSFIETGHNMNELSNIECVKLEIRMLDGKKKKEETREIYVTDFLKSNSMSKDCQMYFINTKCEDKYGNNFKEELLKRTLLDFNDKKSILSKLYSYSGTLCSDCTLLRNIKFNEDEIVIIKDKFDRDPIYSDCVTMISIDSVYDKIRKISDYSDTDFPKFLKYISCLEMNALCKSKRNIKNEKIVELLEKYEKAPADDLKSFKKYISKLVDDYSDVGNSQDKVKWERISVKNYPFSPNLFDGEGLISKEFCDELRKELKKELNSDVYDNSNSFQIRLPYIKGMVHSCDIKGFFKEKGLDSIASKHVLFYKGKEYDINKVKMILTESQFKMDSFTKTSTRIKSMKDYIDYIDKYNYPFGVVNCDKGEARSGKDEYCSLEYQFISTLPLSIKTIKSIRDSIMGMTNELSSKDNIVKSLKNSYEFLDEEEKNNPANKIKQEMDMYNLNSSFYFATKKYKKRKYDIFRKNKSNAIFSKFDVHGYRKYLSSDLLELLYHAAYNEYSKFDSKLWMRVNDYYLPTKHYIETSAVFLRSPHYSRNEIVFLNRKHEDKMSEREKYFGHLTGVVMINPRSLASERLGGADYDGDTVVIVTEKVILDDVKNEIIKYDNSKINYSYMPCKIPSLKGDNSLIYNEKKHRLKCLQNTFSSSIGKLSNKALIDAAYVYNEPNSENNDHSKIAEYTILSGIEIDSAKSGKKPELPQLAEKSEHSKEAIYKCLQSYLEAKKAFDQNSSISKIYPIIEDLLRDENIDLDNNDTYGSNVLNVMYIMDELKAPKHEEINNSYKFDQNKYDISDDYPKVLALAEVYSETTNLIARVLSPKAKEANSDKKDIIYSQLSLLLNDKDISVDDLLNSADIDNLEANDLLSRYIEDSSFHYLTNKKDREKYIKELLPNINDPKVIDAITDFTNDGFRILFLYLNYLSRNITKCELNFTSSILPKIDYFDETEAELFNKYLIKYRKYINDNLDIDNSPLESYSMLIKYLKEESKNISFGDVLSSINIYTSSMIYDVFFELLKKELGGEVYGK